MAIKLRVKSDSPNFAPDPNKTKEQLIQELKTGADGEDDLSLSIRKINLMTNEDIVDRIIQIDNQATIMKWRMWWVIRQRFESDKLFGQWIEEFRGDATRTLCPSSTKEIYRAYTAGKFCEFYEINNLSIVGVSQTVIYELSRPVNEAIAGEVFNAVKFQRTPVHEVKRLLEQARSIDPVHPAVFEMESGERTNDIDKESNIDVGNYLYDEPESNVEVIDYEEVDSVIEVANEEDDDAFEEFVKTIKTHHLSSSSVRALIRRLNKLLEEM
jgi:hypothetical protein